MIYYKKQPDGIEEGVYVKDVGWFKHEECGEIKEAEKNCLEFFIQCEYTKEINYVDVEKKFESHSPTSKDCLIDGDKHIGFYCYGQEFLFANADEGGMIKGERRIFRYKEYRDEKNDGQLTGEVYYVYFNRSVSYINEYMKKNKKIDSGYFTSHSNVVDLVIPDGVEFIGARAFSGCKNLRSIIIAPTVKFIDVTAFSSCPSLDYVVFLGATELAADVFKWCDYLKVAFSPKATLWAGSFAIYNKIKKIGDSAYYGNYGLDHYSVEKVYFQGTESEYKQYYEKQNLKGYFPTESGTNVFYYSEEPSKDGWRFVDGLPKEW